MSEPNEESLQSVYITVPDAETARAIARALVGERLVACVNILPRISSVYLWQERIEEETECLLLAKTRVGLVQRVTARVEELHPYDTPCVLALPIASAAPAYRAWLLEAVHAPETSRSDGNGA